MEKLSTALEVKVTLFAFKQLSSIFPCILALLLLSYMAGLRILFNVAEGSVFFFDKSLDFHAVVKLLFASTLKCL